MIKNTILKVLSRGVLLSFLFSFVVSAGALTQGFKTTVSMPSGSVVSLSKDSSNSVEKTTQENESALIGVAATAKDSLIDLQPAGSEIRVAVSGDTSLLVTDFNGEIKTGDLLSISPLSGIAMKFTTNVSSKKIIATAGASFDGKGGETKEVEVVQADGTKKTVSIGRILVKLVLNDRVTVNTKQSQNVLASISQKLTGKQISPVKLIASTVIAVSTFTLSGLILNGSVKGSFISLGRNPLSRDSIVSGLLRASILAIVIIAMGLSLAYLILLI